MRMKKILAYYRMPMITSGLSDPRRDMYQFVLFWLENKADISLLVVIMDASQPAAATSAVPTQAAALAAEVKKRPGRPRKKPLRPPMECIGVSAAPKQPENLVEFIFNKPMIYKKVFTLFKAADAKELMFVFDKAEVRVYTTDRREKVHFMVVFDCSKIVHYHCSEKTVATINAEHIEMINQILDKNNIMVSIISKKISFRESIIFVFQNEMKIDTICEITLITPTITQQCSPSDFEVKEHEINWEWPSAYLKKVISDINGFTDTFTAQKNGTGRLTFPYRSEDGLVRIQNITKDPTLSKLNASTSDGDIFSVSALIEYIKPVSSTIIADSVRIFADRRKKMIFASDLDEGCIIVRAAVNIVTAGAV
jgi:hypothetical protein